MALWGLGHFGVFTTQGYRGIRLLSDTNCRACLATSCISGGEQGQERGFLYPQGWPNVATGRTIESGMDQGEHINPEVLKWARETAGLTVAEAAEKLGLKDSAKASAVEKLQGLEDGKRDVAETTLQKAASLYRRPLIAFYLAAPPARGERGEDFRSCRDGLGPRKRHVGCLAAGRSRPPANGA